MSPDRIADALEVKDPGQPKSGAMLMREDGLPTRLVLAACQSSASQNRARFALVGKMPDGQMGVVAEWRAELN